ncbi:hypothetical protein K438DRAFT_1159366 [Mycena galopus ATCC 62051]|nr:hypothetical protein K438DRAFT_1159366 [Mycena galopus ATCC 62051]
MFSAPSSHVKRASCVLYARVNARQRKAYEAVLGARIAGGAVRSRRLQGIFIVIRRRRSIESRCQRGGGKNEGGRCAHGDTRAKGKSQSTDAEREAEEEEEAERRRAAEAFVKRGPQKHVNNMKLAKYDGAAAHGMLTPVLFCKPGGRCVGGSPTAHPRAAPRARGGTARCKRRDSPARPPAGRAVPERTRVLLFSQFTTLLR